MAKKINGVHVATIQAITQVNAALTDQESAVEQVRADKAAASEHASAWFVDVLSSEEFETIPALLTQAGQAMRQAGLFGSDEVKYSEKTRKSVASHYHERTLRFFQRVWKAEHAKNYGMELKGSTVMRFEDFVPKAQKTWKDTVSESLTKQGMMADNVRKVMRYAGELFSEQDVALAELTARAEELKTAQADDRQKDLQRAAAQAMAAVTGESVEDCLKMIAERQAAKAA